MIFLLFFIILKPYHEILGSLKKIKEADDKNNWILSLNLKKEIIVPKKSFSLDELTDFKNMRVGIFRYGEDSYAIRKASVKEKIDYQKKNKATKKVFRGKNEYNVFKGEFGTTLVPVKKEEK